MLLFLFFFSSPSFLSSLPAARVVTATWRRRRQSRGSRPFFSLLLTNPVYHHHTHPVTLFSVRRRRQRPRSPRGRRDNLLPRLRDRQPQPLRQPPLAHADWRGAAPTLQPGVRRTQPRAPLPARERAHPHRGALPTQPPRALSPLQSDLPNRGPGRLPKAAAPLACR